MPSSTWNGILISDAQQMRGATDLLARRQSAVWRFLTRLMHSWWKSEGVGAAWKYKYPGIEPRQSTSSPRWITEHSPPKISSLPSPLRTILTPIALIFRLRRYIGVDALTVVTSYVSRW
jgi:hypothetical protein